MDSHRFKGISIRNAGSEAGLPYSTAKNRILGLKSGEFGGLEEEELFADFVLASADLLVPLTIFLYQAGALCGRTLFCQKTGRTVCSICPTLCVPKGR